MASRSLKNVCVCLCFQIVFYQFVSCQIGTSTTSRRLDLDVSLLTPPVCGDWNCSVHNIFFDEIQTKMGVQDIVGGVPARHGDLPWMALLGYNDTSGPISWRCGGSLVSQRHVLTAAHCIHKHENELNVVRLGELDYKRKDEVSPIDVLIKQAIKHEDYDDQTSSNDIGLLILEEDVEFTNFIRPICLPTREDLSSESFVNYKAIVAGWGISELNAPPESHLQMTIVKVVDNSICAQSYSGYSTIMDERVLCARDEKGRKGPCNGDSGGPLIIYANDQEQSKKYFYQIGIYVYSGKCADFSFPGVYMRVTSYLPWIQTYMSKNID